MNIYSRMRYVILWREPRTTGVILLSLLVIFISLVYYSVIQVATCIAIPCLILTLAIRSLAAAKCFFLKKPMENPFQCWLSEEWELSGNRMDTINKYVADTVNRIVLNIKKKLLVEEVFNSVKGLLYLFVWYYIGKYLSGMTLLFIGCIGLFSIPKLCEMYRRELDMLYKRLDQKYNEIIPRLHDRIPLLAANWPHKNKSTTKTTTTTPPPPSTTTTTEATEVPKDGKEEKTD